MEQIVVVEKGEWQSGHGHFYNIATEIGTVEDGPGGICPSIQAYVIDLSGHLRFEERQTRLLPYMFKVVGTTTGDYNLQRERVLVLVQYGKQMLQFARDANEASKREGWFGLGYAREYLKRISEDLDPKVFKHNPAHEISQTSGWAAMLIHESLFVVERSDLSFNNKGRMRQSILDLAFKALDEVCGDIKPMTTGMALKVEEILARGARRYDRY